MNSRPQIRKAKLDPVNCYTQGKNLLGGDYWLFLGLIFVGLLIGGLVPIILLGAAWCGIASCFLNKSVNKPVTFNTLFEGFEDFVAGLIAAVCFVGIAFLAAIPYMIGIFGGMALLATGEPVLAIVGVMMFAGAIVYIVIVNGFFSVGLLFSGCLIVEHKMEGFNAVQTAMSGMFKNFWGIVFVSIVGNLMILVGTLLCVVPGLLLIPMVTAGHFICYRKIFSPGPRKPTGMPQAPVKAY